MTSCPVRVPPFFEGDGLILVEQWGDLWITRAPIVYFMDEGHVTVPEGWLLDFASTPAIVWPILAPTDPCISAAAALHDFLYGSHLLSREDADRILWEAMGVVRCPARRITRRIVWRAVRMFGGWSYTSGPTRQAELRRQYERLIAAQA